MGLRRFLGADAVVTGVNGLVYAVASGPVGRLLGVESGLLWGLGVGLVVFAVGVGALAARAEPPRFGVQLVVEVNAAWAVLSVLGLVLWFAPTGVGAVWIALQAAVVGAFAGAQYLSLRA